MMAKAPGILVPLEHTADYMSHWNARNSCSDQRGDCLFRGMPRRNGRGGWLNDLAAMVRLGGKENCRTASYVEESVRGVWVDAPAAGNGRKKV